MKSLLCASKTVMSHVGKAGAGSKEDVSFVVLGAYDYLSTKQIAIDVLLVHPQFNRAHGKSRHARPDVEGVLAQGGLDVVKAAKRGNANAGMSAEGLELLEHLHTGESDVVMNVFDAISGFVDEQAVEYAAC